MTNAERARSIAVAFVKRERLHQDDVRDLLLEQDIAAALDAAEERAANPPTCFMCKCGPGCSPTYVCEGCYHELVFRHEEAMEKAVLSERERCARVLERPMSDILLHAGEMTAQERRTVKAVLRWLAAEIRRGE